MPRVVPSGEDSVHNYCTVRSGSWCGLSTVGMTLATGVRTLTVATPVVVIGWHTDPLGSGRIGFNSRLPDAVDSP